MTTFNLTPLLTTQEAAHLLGLSPRTLESLRVRGGGPEFVKLGRLVRYERNSLDAWITSNCKTSTSEAS